MRILLGLFQLRVLTINFLVFCIAFVFFIIRIASLLPLMSQSFQMSPQRLEFIKPGVTNGAFEIFYSSVDDSDVFVAVVFVTEFHPAFGTGVGSAAQMKG